MPWLISMVCVIALAVLGLANLTEPKCPTWYDAYKRGTIDGINNATTHIRKGME